MSPPVFLSAPTFLSFHGREEPRFRSAISLESLFGGAASPGRHHDISRRRYEELQAQEFRFAERKQAERVEADLKAAQEEEEDADGKEADGKETDGEAADGKGAAVATTEDAKAQTGKKGDKGPPGKRKNANRRGKAGVDSGGSKPKKTEEPVEEKKSAFSLIRMHDCEVLRCVFVVIDGVVGAVS